MNRNEMHESDCTCSKHSVAAQSFDELEFSRGIWTAALDGDLNKVKFFIKEKKIDPSKRDTYGYTALHYASRSGHTKVCELLLENRADPNSTTTAGGSTSLHRAAYMGHLDVMSLLLKFGADPSIADSDGRTPLHKAGESQNYKAAELLLKARPCLRDIKDRNGRSAFEYIKPENSQLINLLKAA